MALCGWNKKRNRCGGHLHKIGNWYVSFERFDPEVAQMKNNRPRTEP